MKFLFLGTGASMGTPVVTCPCEVCTSSESKNRRLRPSGLLKVGNRQFLFDAGPDFRQQALRSGINDLQGIFITHTHFDHIAGLDDLRVFYFLKKQKLPCLLSRESYEELKLRFHYFFTGPTDDVMGGSRFDYVIVDDSQEEVEFEGLQVCILNYEQLGMKVSGYRIGQFAYVMDLKTYASSLIDQLKGVEVLVMSALRERPSPAHLTLAESIEFAKAVGARQTWFSHIAHDLDHHKTSKILPTGINLAYDGLEIDVDRS